MIDTERGVFQKFNDLQPALDIVTLLGQHNIDTQLELLPGPPPLPGQNHFDEYALTIALADFERARQLILNEQIRLDDFATERAYLEELTDEELLDVVAKPDKWGEFDSLCAQKILTERGLPISPIRLADMQKQRAAELARQGRFSLRWAIFVFVCLMPPGIIGVVAGLHIIRQKSVLPDGRKIYGYTYRTRVLATIIFGAGICWLGFCVWLCIVRLMGYYPNGLFG